MKNKVIKLILLVFVVFSPFANSLTQVSKFDGLFYYEIGGANPISVPPAPIITSINLEFSISPTGIACGAFDPKLAIEAFFDDLKNGVDDMMVAMQNAATAAIAALPGYILQKANPGLYDLFQNGLLRGIGKITLATKSCEQMMAQINNGVDPYENWVTASAGDEWKLSAGSGGASIVNVRKDIAENKGESGKRWMGGVSCGGRNQPPCRPLRDAVQAGFNISMGRGVLDTSSVPATTSELTKIWNDPDDVRDWVLDVLGDEEIVMCQGCTPGSQPGRGLIPLIAERQEVVHTNMELIIRGASNGGIDPTRTNLDLISAPGVGISVHVIESIRRLSSPTDIGIVMSRLSMEIAGAQVMQEATLVRRLLLTGRKEGNIGGVGMAQDAISRAITELEQEIHNVTFESDLRKTMVSGTVKKVLEESRSIQNASQAVLQQTDTRNRSFRNGKVSP
jgi:integrating conjugative element protein (TIGR03755 family)